MSVTMPQLDTTRSQSRRLLSQPLSLSFYPYFIHFDITQCREVFAQVIEVEAILRFLKLHHLVLMMVAQIVKCLVYVHCLTHILLAKIIIFLESQNSRPSVTGNRYLTAKVLRKL